MKIFPGMNLAIIVVLALAVVVVIGMKKHPAEPQREQATVAAAQQQPSAPTPVSDTTPTVNPGDRCPPTPQPMTTHPAEQGHYDNEASDHFTGTTESDTISVCTAGNSHCTADYTRPWCEGAPPDAGSGPETCKPCIMMVAVMDELRKEYSNTLQVDFIDVNKDQAAARQYGIRAIPTQIFFNAEGKEIFRHLGYFPKEDIVAKFKELGITLHVADLTVLFAGPPIHRLRSRYRGRARPGSARLAGMGDTECRAQPLPSHLHPTDCRLHRRSRQSDDPPSVHVVGVFRGRHPGQHRTGWRLSPPPSVVWRAMSVRGAPMSLPVSSSLSVSHCSTWCLLPSPRLSA